MVRKHTRPTGMQELFCQEYLVDLNAKDAAIRAGYKEKHAGKIGYNLLQKPIVQDRIQELQKETIQKIEIRKEDNLRILKIVRDTLISDILDFDGKKITFQALDKIPKELLPAIKTIKQKETKTGMLYIEIQLYDRLAAIDMLNKMLGFNEPEKVEHSGEVSQLVIYQLPDNGR